MKKTLVLLLAFILVVSLCACNREQPAAPENQQSQNGDDRHTTDDTPAGGLYKLTVMDHWGYLVKPLDEYYEAGAEVEVTLAFLSGPAVGIELNGEYIGENFATKYDGACPVITFTMPARDSVLYTTQNGNVGNSSAETH